MNPAFEEIKEKAEVRETRSEAASLSATYVAAHPGEFTEYSEMTIEECVKALETMREAGLAESQWRIEIWIMYKWEPQNIGGTVGPVERILTEGEALQ